MSSTLARGARSRIVGFAVAAVLVVLLFMKAAGEFRYQSGIDFYQFWGVPLAMELSGTPRSPYVDGPGYAATLNAMADASRDPRLRRANAARRVLEPMGTPFLYVAFSAFPADFGVAQAGYVILLYIAAGVSVFAIARMRDCGDWWSVWLALGVLLTFRPLYWDVTVGNVNSLQLAFLAAWIAAAARIDRRTGAFADALLVACLAPFAIFKPNTIWIVLALAAHRVAVRGMARLVPGLALGALLAIAAYVAGAWFFHNGAVWLEWLQLARGLDGSGLPLTIDQGNLAVAMWLFQHTGALGSLGWGALLGALLLAAVAVSALAGGMRPTASGSRTLMRDPWFAASLGVLLTFATTPMLWTHYTVLGLVPMFWLATNPAAGLAGRIGAAAFYLASFTLLLDALFLRGATAAGQVCMALGWTALVPGILVHVHRTARRGSGE